MVGRDPIQAQGRLSTLIHLGRFSAINSRVHGCASIIHRNVYSSGSVCIRNISDVNF
jgi:hypothetical protein